MENSRRSCWSWCNCSGALCQIGQRFSRCAFACNSNAYFQWIQECKYFIYMWFDLALNNPSTGDELETSGHCQLVFEVDCALEENPYVCGHMGRPCTNMFEASRGQRLYRHHHAASQNVLRAQYRCQVLQSFWFARPSLGLLGLSGRQHYGVGNWRPI